MRLSTLLPLLTATTTTLALPIAIANPFDISVLGMCLTGHQHCHDGPGLFTSMFASGPGAAGAASHKRSEQGTELGVGGLLGNLPLLSSLFGMGDQSKSPTPSSKGSGSGGGGLGGLGLKERGEEAGVTDLFSSLPLLGSLFGGQAKNSPSSAGGPVMEPSGRKQHLGGSLGL